MSEPLRNAKALELSRPFLKGRNFCLYSFGTKCSVAYDLSSPKMPCQWERSRVQCVVLIAFELRLLSISQILFDFEAEI